jgi:hypothetical protein
MGYGKSCSDLSLHVIFQAMQSLDAEVREQVERILCSATFQRSESLQRVLSYLAERSMSDGPDQLKEYAIGMDVFGKGKDYDTRLDSSVRIQVGRLRQKLIEYYAVEGVNDEIIVALPKGQFKLLFEHRVPGRMPGRSVPENGEPIEPHGVDLIRSGEVRWRRIALALAVTLAAVVVWGSITYITLRRGNHSTSSELRWTPATEAFWQPFVGGDRPLIIAAGIPLFVGIRGCCLYRDLGGSNRWDETVQTQNFKILRKALNNPDLFDGRSYTTMSEAKSLMLLGELLGQRMPKIRFAKSNDLSWQELSDNNVLFLGSKNVHEVLSALPVNLEIISEPTGLRVLHPGEGEPGFIPDAYDQELHALISVLPGPSGKGFVGIFSGSLGPEAFAAKDTRAEGFADSLGAGCLPAVEYATSPASLEEFASRIKDKAGKIPAYFQVALGVKFKGGVPISSHFLLGRELRIEHAAVTQKIAH